MRWADYVDLRQMPPFEQLLESCRDLASRGASCLVFPEGHRSKDGRLQRFRSGAFQVASECDIPVLPVCITGTENLTTGKWLFLRPTHVNIDVLPPVHPASLPVKKRALRLRRQVEGLFRDHLGE